MTEEQQLLASHIEPYALIGDTHAAALVAAWGHDGGDAYDGFLP